MEIISHMTYSNPDGTADITIASGSIAVPAESYANWAAVQALSALNYALIDLQGPADRRATRVRLGIGAVGSDGNSSKEDVYLLFQDRATISGVDTQRIRVEKLGSIAWTQGAVAIGGGRTSHKHAKTAVWTPTGLSAALGFGQEIVNAVTGTTPFPASVVIGDVGPAIGILRSLALGASSPSTGIAPRHHAWR